MIKKIYLLLVSAFLISGCSDFLDTENLTKKDSSNFPKTIEDIETALVSVYSVNTAVAINGCEKWQMFQLISELMADYSLSGGGVDNTNARAIAEYKQNVVNMYSGLWKRYYSGIYRANFLIENIDRVKFGDNNEKNKILGQAYFLRGEFFFNLARLFENIPLTLSTVPENLPQAKPDETFSQILSDFKMAVDLLPAVKFRDIPKTELGRATKWAAEAMLGRAYLFYSGTYGKSTVALPEGGNIDKQYVINVIDDCISNSGHDLLPDYRSLWPYSFSSEYKYTKDNRLSWIGESGDNNETVYAYKFSNMASFQEPNLCNNLNLFYGVRGQETLPFGKGWGFATVVPKLFAEWDNSDLRKRATIWDTSDMTNEGVTFKWNQNRAYNETGYFNKKYMPVNVKNDKGKLVNYSCELYGVTPNFQLNNTQDVYVIRFADVLLMGAELGGSKAQDYLDRVRKRVHLSSVPLTLDNIKAERLHELAYEGVRYHDLMRWGDIENEVNRMQKDVHVKIMGTDKVVTKTFRAVTRGFLPIPEDQIELSNGVLKQNDGWGTVDALFKD